MGGSAVLGGGAGLVVGLFAPPLLLATAVGAGIGAGVAGALVKKHQEKQMGVDLEGDPPGPSIAVRSGLFDDTDADRVDRALNHATKKVSKAIDSGDYDKLQKALDDAATDIGKALLNSLRQGMSCSEVGSDRCLLPTWDDRISVAGEATTAPQPNPS